MCGGHSNFFFNQEFVFQKILPTFATVLYAKFFACNINKKCAEKHEDILESIS